MTADIIPFPKPRPWSPGSRPVLNAAGLAGRLTHCQRVTVQAIIPPLIYLYPTTSPAPAGPFFISYSPHS